MGRVIAIDFGEKRIGVAMSDETNRVAFARPYIPTDKKEQLIELIKEQGVDEILLGLPKSLGGQATKMTREVREFQTWLQSKSKVPIKLIDERLTSKEVQRGLRGEKGARSLIDSLVAQKILERYLEEIRDY